MDVKQIDAGDLDVGYVDAGPQDGPAVLLLHGWPYDIHAFDEVTPMLVAEGCRVIVPYLRGYGTTRFLSDETPRNGEQAAFAVDATALMDALEIERATVAGFDWGSRAAAIMAALWPERCAALVAVSGYLIGSVEINQKPLPPEAELGWWYLFYFATERGRRGYRQYTARFHQADLAARLAEVGLRRRHLRPHRGVVRQPGPRRHRDPQLPLAVGPRRGRRALPRARTELAERPTIEVPTITIASDFDGPNADGRAYADRFTGPYEHRILDGIGHNVPQEAPTAFAEAVLELVRQEAAQPRS